MLAAMMTMVLAAASAPSAEVQAAVPVSAAPIPAVLATATVQQLFETATAADDRGDDALALTTYDAIEKRLARRGNSPSLAILRARRGVLLLRLDRREEASAALRYAEANLPCDQAVLQGDCYFAALSLGQIAEQALDLAAALRWYERAEKNADAASRPFLWSSRARAMMFDDPRAALALIDRAIAIKADPAARSAALAPYHTLRGRILLNSRDFPAAQAELKKAVADLGGLTQRLDMNDVVARSDFAIAAMLNGDEDAARQYLAFTGAGTQRDVLSPASEGDAPPCGGPADLTPEDVAVIEFAIRDDGSVMAVAPIYASRNGLAAQEFARAVAGWSWTKEEAAKIKPFFRKFVRVELRCSSGSKRPSVTELLAADAYPWLAAHGVTLRPVTGTGAARALPLAQGELRRMDGGGSPPIASLQAISNILKNPLSDLDERRVLAARAVAIVEAADAPAPVLALYAIARAMADEPSTGRSATARRMAKLDSVAGQPVIAADPKARSAIWLIQADTLIQQRRREEALPFLERIGGNAALDPHDPLKVAALVRLASIRATEGNLAAARAVYERTGLTAQQCALVDAKPALVHDNAGSENFPLEAMRWGFEGWAQTEFDIAADGRTANVRTIIAYPPFVFSPASISILKGARFTQSYRPEGGLGCGGQQKRIRYGLPGHK